MIIVPDVEAIMSAFQNLLSTATNIASFGNVVTVTRVWQPWDQVAQIAQPAIVIVEGGETVRDRRGQQPAVTLDVMLICYIRVDPNDTTYPPNTRINSFVKSIRTALLPQGADVTRNAQTLNGLVSNAFIDGKIVKDAGILDDQGSVMIPVSLLLS